MREGGEREKTNLKIYSMMMLSVGPQSHFLHVLVLLPLLLLPPLSLAHVLVLALVVLGAGAPVVVVVLVVDVVGNGVVLVYARVAVEEAGVHEEVGIAGVVVQDVVGVVVAAAVAVVAVIELHKNVAACLMLWLLLLMLWQGHFD